MCSILSPAATKRQLFGTLPIDSEDERWLIRETEGATVDFDRETGPKRNTIDILMQGSRKRLLLIHCIEIASEPINQTDMKRRKRETEVFSLSFLDCVCCGGAVLLLFVLTVGRSRIP